MSLVAIMTGAKRSSMLLVILLSCVIAGGSVWLHTAFEDSFVFTIAVIVLSVSCWLMQGTAHVFHLRYLTIPGFWYLTYVMMIFIPSLFVFMDKGSTGYRYLIGVQSVLLTVPLGMLLANGMFRFHPSEIRRYFESRIQKPRISFHLFILSLLGLSVSVGITLLYISEVATVPLFYMFRNFGDHDALVLLREDALKLLDSPFRYIYSLQRTLVFPFLIIVTLGYFLITRHRRWFALFFASFVGGLLYAAFTTAKAPVANLLLLVFVFIYLYKGGGIRTKWFVFAIAIVFAFPVLVLQGLYYGTQNSAAGIILYSIIERLFYAPAKVLYWYFELFPGNVGYLYGRSIGKLSWLMGWEYFNTPNYVGIYGFHSSLKSVNANGAFIGNLNADFGMVGVVLGGLLVGWVMQTIQIRLLRQRKTIITMAVYAFMILAFWGLNSTAFPVVLATDGVLLVLLIPLVIRIGHQVLQVSTAQSATS